MFYLSKTQKKIAAANAVSPNIIPIDIGVIHLVGIGGIGMSGIAEILHNLGYQVSGSDLSESGNVMRLRKLGVNIMIGHKAENVANASVVVRSSAVTMDNPEIVAAQQRHLPVVKRSEMLAELTRLKSTIAVTGSHGKTTTTSLICKILETAKFDPTVINGGVINSYGTNAYLGSGSWMVAEADESDGTFIKIPAVIGVLTNIDPEHLDYWKNFNALREACVTFVENLPFYGFAVLCIDHPEVAKIARSITDRKIVTYSLDKKDADIVAENIRRDSKGAYFNVRVSKHLAGEEKIISDIFLPMLGIFNVQNALAAIAVAQGLKIEDEYIINALANFAGVKRRFTKTGEVNGIEIIDDYAHHPVEINATLTGAKEMLGGKGRILAVMQPHRYTRLHDLFEEFCNCFKSADKVIITPIYTAGEDPIEGITQENFVKALTKNSVDVKLLPEKSKLAGMINEMAKPGDVVVCLGAGSISSWAYDLPSELENLRN